MALKNSKKSFWQKYKWWLIIFGIILIVGYVIIYVCFKGNGFLYAGIDLEKRDWLSFLGAYLTFAGTAIVSLIAIFQSRYFVEIEREKAAIDRLKVLQPVFSVNIEGINKQVAGTAEEINLYNSSTQIHSKHQKHQNVTISIENVGEYPVRNVIVFNKYLFQLLKPNEKKTIQIAYSDSPDIQRWKKHLIEILESEFERSEEGIPKWFNINYDDIDGNEMFQTFELKDFDGTKYYSLEGTHQV